MTSRSYCFTSYKEKMPATFDTKYVRYIVYQKEKCPETNRDHYQGYIELKTPIRLKACQKLIGDPVAHLEKREGTREQARTYCMKNRSRIEEPIEWGEWKAGGQGTRNDLHEIGELIVSGEARASDIAESNPSMYIRYHRGLKALQTEIDRKKIKDFRKVEVHILHGEAGTGKTRRAVEQAKGDYHILTQGNGNNLWLDGYTNQKTLIIDDFYGWIKYGKFLTMLDGYKIPIEVKGGFVYPQWEKIIVTSNKPPDEWYSRGMTPALKRRITSIEELALVLPTTPCRDGALYSNL